MSREYPFAALEFERCSEAEQKARSREFYERLARRRTVRDFAGDPVPREAIRTAASAPSGANLQPWRFEVVTEPELKRAIREAAEAEEKESYERRMPAEWREALAPLGTDWHKEFLEICPALIVVFALDHGVREDGTKFKHYYVQESVGIACGFLLAALHCAGLATLTHTPSPMGFLREILGRPANERPYLLIPVGYPAQEARVPVIGKKEFDEICRWR